MSNNNQQNTAAGEAIGTVFLVLFVFGLGFVWSSAELGMWLFHGHFFRATDAAVANAVVHFPKHLSNPAAAWPAPFSTELPDAKQYWCAIWLVVGIPALVALGIVAFV